MLDEDEDGGAYGARFEGGEADEVREGESSSGEQRKSYFLI